LFTGFCFAFYIVLTGVLEIACYQSGINLIKNWNKPAA
jgi:hypothetical protein